LTSHREFIKHGDDEDDEEEEERDDEPLEYGG